MGELVANKPKPVIFSCRRRQDGGEWEGSEEERLALLRQCIISKADFVEIELDAADQIRKFPPAKRVISYTNFQETPADIAEIYAEMQTKSPDVIKLVTLARTPEEAWPLVQILAKPALPTVVVGLGKPGAMLTVLGKKIGARFTYAALERGMEAYPGQPSVGDLERVYHYKAIGKSTRLIGVTGFAEQEMATVAVLNGALADLGVAARCLPLQIGSMHVFRKVIDAVKLAAVVVDAEHYGSILEIATERQPEARSGPSRRFDFAPEGKVARLQRAGPGGGWSTRGNGPRRFGKSPPARRSPGHDRRVQCDRAGDCLRPQGAWRRNHHRQPGPHPAHDLAKELDARHIPLEALYSTMHDVLVVCSEEKQPVSSKGHSEGASIHAAELKRGMVVMDLTSMPKKSALLREAEAHGCQVVSPRRILLEQLHQQTRLLSGKEVPLQRLNEILSEVIEEED